MPADPKKLRVRLLGPPPPRPRCCLRRPAAVLAFSLGLALAAAGAQAATVRVNSTLDNNVRDDVLTLREAILVATGLPVGFLTAAEQAQVQGTRFPTEIRFDLAPGQVIAIGSSGAGRLPVIDQPVDIEGGGVVLNGAAVGGFEPGLWITAGGSTVRHLVMQGFTAAAIMLQDRGGNVIEGNFLGTDAAGLTRERNYLGIWISRSVGNRIGGFVADPSAGCQSPCNLISGNTFGILIQEPTSTGNVIEGNFIGTNALGTGAIGNSEGVRISNAPQNRVGCPRGDGAVPPAPCSDTQGSTAPPFELPSNLISGNFGINVGIEGAAATGSLVQGNFVGPDITGRRALRAFTEGVRIDSPDNLVGGPLPGEGNLVSGNVRGVVFAGPSSQRNHVEGNRIGTTADGGAPLANEYGIAMLGILGGPVGYPQSITVGAAAAAPFAGCTGACNLISGNDLGVAIDGNASTLLGHVVRGNFIGTDPQGEQPVGNRVGAQIIGPNNQIGGAAPGEGNLISGNRESGIVLGKDTARGNRIEGNRIGTAANGSAKLPNLLHGVDLKRVIGGGATETTIGGLAAGARNLISGNGFDGIFIESTRNRVLGNWIGLGAQGAALGNGRRGVTVSGADNRIGRLGAAEDCAFPCNVISANGDFGLVVQGGDDNVIQGNAIGTDAAGGTGLGNRAGGIAIQNASRTRVGGTSPAEGSVIAGNGGPGVAMLGSGRGNTVRANPIHDNEGLGIDLGGDGVTLNDADDADAGPNDLLNTPLSVSVDHDATGTRISAILHPSDGSETIDFYANTAGDASGFGEGETFLGTATATGGERFELVVPLSIDPRSVSATATNRDGSTSELSPLQNPLLFVPGIAASRLNDRALGNQELWLGAFPLSFSPRLSLFPSDLRQQSPLPDIVPGDVIRYYLEIETPHLRLGASYAPLLAFLIGPAGYREYRRGPAGCNTSQAPPTLWVYAYDWRSSNGDNTARLREQIDCIHRFYPGARVDLLAHSMGGLQARRYILEHPRDHDVRRMITLGSPFLGSLKGANVLETGSFIEPLRSASLRDASRSFAGVHELLPSRGFFDLKDPAREGFAEDGWDFNRNSTAFEVYDYDQFKAAMNLNYGRVDPPLTFMPGDTGDAFHEFGLASGDNQDDWRADSSGVDYHHVFGVQSGETTIGRIRTVVERVCASPELPWVCIDVDAFALDKTAGDGTVPRVSAERRGNGPGLNRTDQVYGFRPPPGRFFGRDDSQTEHTSMVGNPEIQATITSLLAQGCAATTPRMFIHPASAVTCPPLAVAPAAWVRGENLVEEPAVEPFYYLRLSGPASPIVRDAEGNTTEPWPGTTLPQSVSGVGLDEVGPDVWQITTPSASRFEVSFAAPDRPMAIAVTLGTGSSATVAVRFPDLALPAGVAALLSLEPGGVVELRYDGDGDGTFETLVPPGVAVTGEAADDLEPPAVEISTATVAGGVRVAVTASDAGSGLERLFYSLDGTHFQPYLAPVVVGPGQGGTFHAFADDRVANRRNVSRALPFTDLAAALAGSPDPAAVGAEVTYALRIENRSQQPAAEVLAQVELPPGVDAVSCTAGAGGACTGTAQGWQVRFDQLAPGAAAEATLVVRVACAAVELAPLVARATVISALLDAQPANNTAAATTGVLDPRAIAPAAQDFPAAGGDGTIQVAAPLDCAWSAASEAPFVAVLSGEHGRGPGAVTYHVEASSTTSARQGVLRVAGQTFSVRQQGVVCSYQVTVPGQTADSPITLSVPGAGATRTARVTAPGDCPWTAESLDPWIAVTSSPAGTGSGDVVFAVSRNRTPGPRAGRLRIAGFEVRVEQPPAATNFYTLTPCRLLDTRGPNGPYGGPVLAAGIARLVTVPGRCGVPATAESVSVNVTVVNPTSAGHLTFYPGDQALPLASTINFAGQQTRANNAILRLSTEGVLGVRPLLVGNGQVDLIIDVNGYFY